MKTGHLGYPKKPPFRFNIRVKTWVYFIIDLSRSKPSYWDTQNCAVHDARLGGIVMAPMLGCEISNILKPTIQAGEPLVGNVIFERWTSDTSIM